MKDRNLNPKQKDFFNQKAAVWDEITVHNIEKVKYIAELMGIRSSDKILDVGTGTGIMIPFYERYLVDGCVVAIDYSDKMIDVARLKYPEKEHTLISYRVSDVYELTYQGDFDLVVCYSCFPHFVNQPLAVEVLSKALRRGRRIVVAHSDSARTINGVHMNGGMEIGNDFLPSMQRLKQMMNDSGLTVAFERDDEDYFICIGRKD
jgi:demethylmenaquinone methyltransferase/2-methoxy-6-polyprenyl-1,4-benzoquinol methylase